MPQAYRSRTDGARHGWIAACIVAVAASVLLAGAASAEAVPEKPAGAVRIAAFNANMVRRGAGVLAKDIAKGDRQVLAVAEILLRVRPDVVLLNEFDHDPAGVALARFAALLADGVGGLPGLDYPHLFAAEPNTGVPSGHDLDGDGRRMSADDALGFGRFPGQYGMAVLSRLPLGPARTFRMLPWAAVPDAEPPRNPDGTPYWPEEVWRSLPLSSKSHWDVTVALPGALPEGSELHLLASHPTSPVFDGPEDRNGLRNAAEIGFWTAYLDGTAFPEDAGETAALPAEAQVVVLGTLNLDPADGDGRREAMRALIGHPRLQDPAPASDGGRAAAAQGGVNAGQRGDPALDTADWRDEEGPGNLRSDFVLPSRGLEVLGAGVFWPPPGDPLARLVEASGRERASSDHRLVWVDLRQRQGQ